MSNKPYWVVGNHAARSILATAPERVLNAAMVSTKEGGEESSEFMQLLETVGVSVQLLNKGALAKLVGSEQHQGIALNVRPKTELGQAELMQKMAQGDRSNRLILVLDQVQDPHNLGACLRTAAASGVDAVVVPKDNSAPLSAIVHKVASGAAETVDLYRVTNLARCLKDLKEHGIWVIGTSDRAQTSLYEQSLTGDIAILMGAEGKGLRRLTEEACDVLVSLPMANNSVSSLNVSVATGVCLYEAVRQRRA